MDPNSLAIEFICPICHKLPIDPVLAEDGFIYCKGCIGEIIDGDDSQVISPMTGEPMVISPMTGEPMETTLIYSDSVKETIRDLTECEELEDGIKGAWAAGKQCTSTGDRILDTKKKAKHGDVEHMVILSLWYLFGEQDGVKRDANKGYNWCKLAADQGDMTGKAYQGYCLIRGLGVERDWEDGYELLIEVASQQLNVVGRDVAAYTLGCCYQRGVYGFKHDTKKAKKWTDKVEFKPTHDMFEILDAVEESQIDDQTQFENDQLRGSSLLFPDGLAVADESFNTYSYLSQLQLNEHDPRKNASGTKTLEVDQCSLPSLSTATTCSTSTGYSAQSEELNLAEKISDCRNLVRGKTCSKGSCSKGVFNSSSTLCLDCRKVVGPK